VHLAFQFHEEFGFGGFANYGFPQPTEQNVLMACARSETQEQEVLSRTSLATKVLTLMSIRCQRGHGSTKAAGVAFFFRTTKGLSAQSIALVPVEPTRPTEFPCEWKRECNEVLRKMVAAG
jgi:hypothetical protein